MKKRNIITASVLAAAMLMTACGSKAEKTPVDPAADNGTETADASATENTEANKADSESGETVEIVYTASRSAPNPKTHAIYL